MKMHTWWQKVPTYAPQGSEAASRVHSVGLAGAPAGSATGGGIPPGAMPGIPGGMPGIPGGLGSCELQSSSPRRLHFSTLVLGCMEASKQAGMPPGMPGIAGIPGGSFAEARSRLAGWLAGNPNILRQAVTVASVKTLEKPEYQANDSGTKSTIFWLESCLETE